MTSADRQALMRLAGGAKSDGVTTDDLQGLLLQVVFALLMIFMIAYFIFVASAKKEQQEQVLICQAWEVHQMQEQLIQHQTMI